MDFSRDNLRRLLSSPWVFLALVAPLISLMLVASVAGRLQDPPAEDVLYAIRPQHPTLTSATLTLSPGWVVGPDGARAAAGERASVEVTLEPGPWQSLRLMINGSVAPTWAVRIGREFEARTVLGVRPGVELVQEAFDLPSPFSPEPLRLTLTPQGGDEAPHLARLGIRLSAYPADQIPLPHLGGAIVGGFLPLALAAFLFAAGRRTERQALLLGGLGGAAAVGAALVRPVGLEPLWAGTTAFALGTAVGATFKIWRDPEHAVRHRRIAEVAALAGVLGLAVFTRWNALEAGWAMPLLPDALGYVDIARHGSFYQTLQAHAPWIREPLFPAVLRLTGLLLPDTVTSMRVVSLMVGVVAVGMAWLVGRRAFSPVVGLLAAAAMAVNPFMADVSIRVLRDDLVLALFLAVMAVIVWAPRGRWVGPVLFALAAGALALVRINMLMLMVPFAVLAAWRGGWTPIQCIAALAIAAAPSIPHLTFNAKVSGGDMLYSSNVHTRYYLNKAMIGEPGFPATVEQWTADPYAGDVVGAGALVHHLGVPAMAWRTVRGYVMIFAWEFPHEMLFRGQEWLMLPGLLGGWVLLRRWRTSWWLVGAFAVFCLPMAMIATIGLDRRLALPAAPLIFWTWAAGLEYLFHQAWQKWGAPRFAERAAKKGA